MPNLPSSVIFLRLSIRAGRLGTGKGNGASRRSLVKYNQRESTPMLAPKGCHSCR
jgi:hypothetical protein